MPDKKGLWSSLFSRGRKSSRKQDQTEYLPSVLKDKYGISIESIELPLSQIQELGYRRMTDMEIARVDTLTQYIPQIAVQNMNAQAVNQAFRIAVDGSYRPLIKEGQHLAKSRVTPGALRGSTLSDATNQVAGSAEWIENNAVLNVSNAPQIALGIFNAVSIITGQYFMSQINGKLASLKEDISRIEGFLDASQRSKLKTACQELEDIIDRLEYIYYNPEQTRSTIEQLHSIERTAQESINLCQELIQTETNTVNTKDDEKRIEKRIGTIAKYLNQELLSVQLFSVSILLEIQLSNISDPEELSVIERQIESRVSSFRSSLAKSKEAIINYLNTSHVLNERTWRQNVTAAGTVVASGLLLGGIPGWMAGITLSTEIDKMFHDDQRKRKASHVENASNYLDPISDESILEAPLETIRKMIKIRNEGADIVMINGEWYTNLPETISDQMDNT